MFTSVNVCRLLRITLGRDKVFTSVNVCRLLRITLGRDKVFTSVNVCRLLRITLGRDKVFTSVNVCRLLRITLGRDKVFTSVNGYEATDRYVSSNLSEIEELKGLKMFVKGQCGLNIKVVLLEGMINDRDQCPCHCPSACWEAD